MKKLLIFLIMLLSLSFAVYAVSFSDTSSHKYKNAIEYIAERGIVEGYEDGTYRPDASINRAELLKIILESNGVDVSDDLGFCFPDVAGDWYAKYVCKAKVLGIIQGYPDGTFKPANHINFVEALKIIELGYGADLDDAVAPALWYQEYLDEAESKNLIPDDIEFMAEFLTRGQMADVITRYLTFLDGTQDEYLASLAEFVGSSVLVDTGQTTCYGNLDSISCPGFGSDFYGQDANYVGNQPSYLDNGDGTISDLNTGLMWQKNPGEKMTFNEAVAGADSFELAGYDDWRMPTIKELYSLILFSGLDPSGIEGGGTAGFVPFIDDDYFDFEYGDESAGERIIDSQFASANKYVGTTMMGDETVFGVNFADGRIKGYGLQIHGNEKEFFVLYVRGNSGYGENSFVDNGDGTITDQSTGLMWMQDDSGEGMLWKEALEYCEDLDFAGHSNWKLPDAKELQYIVDYSRSPSTTGSAAIDPVFNVSSIVDEGGGANYPFYWTSTTHANMHSGGQAAYIAFGEALGWMKSPHGDYNLLDVHGAGAQRSDPKVGDPEDYPHGHGPQGDVIRVYNYVRCVR